MAELRRIFLLIACFILLTGAEWYTGTDPLQQQWYVDKAVKWSVAEDPFTETSGLDAPRQGFTRNFKDVQAPSGITTWLLSRFQDLTAPDLDPKWVEETQLWYKDPLPASTKWIDAKAGPDTGQVKFTLNGWHDFTVFRIDPTDGYVDQDFQGNALVHGLGDDKRYRIHAWDGRGYLGAHTLSISDKFARALSTSSDLWDGRRIPTMAQKVAADPNDDLWMSVYRAEAYGLNYRFIRIYSIESDGRIRADFQVPLTTSYIRPWLSDLILEDNGDVTFSACEDPMGLSSYFGPSYVARLTKAGDVVWATDTGDLSSAICIAPLGDGGYVYGGAHFTVDPLELDKQFGRLCRLDSAGGATNWAVSGTTYVDLNYSVRDIKRSGEEYTYSGSAIDDQAIPQEYGGSCSMTFNPAWGACEAAFDTGVGAIVGGSPADGYTDCSVTWDLGGTTQVATGRVYIAAGATGGDHTLYVEGSNNGVDWTEITNWHMGETAAATEVFDEYVVSDAYRYYRLRFHDSGAGTINTFVDTFWPYGAVFSGNGTDNYHYTAGRYNTGSVGRLFSPIQTEGCPSDAENWLDAVSASDSECCDAMDGNTSNTGKDWEGDGNCTYSTMGCGWNMGANQTAVRSKVWYNITTASTITLQYHDGAAWQAISSVAGTVSADADEINLWDVSFAEVTAANWRVTFTSAGTEPCDPYLDEWQLYPPTATTGGGIVSKQVLSGVTGGTELWGTKYTHSESEAGIFNAVTVSPRDESRIYAFGSSEHSIEDLSLNKGIGLCVNQSGTSIWTKDFPQVSEFYDASPTEDGGFLLAGTLYSGTSVQARSAVILKIDRDGNVDPKFPQTFAEDERWADGRGIIETNDNGALLVGGSSDSAANNSRPYYIKLDRFLRSRTKGRLYN